MVKYKIVIKQIIITPELFTIISTDGIKFVSKINKGSIKFKIYNEDYQQVNLCNINEDDIVNVFKQSLFDFYNNRKLKR